MTKTVVVFGDIVIDFVSFLTDIDWDKIADNVNSPIDCKVGGAAIQFAIAAKSNGFETPHLIGKVGGIQHQDQVLPDTFGEIIISYLDTNKVSFSLAFDLKSGTGKVIVIYLPNQKRLMISDQLANKTFSKEDITPEMINIIIGADLFYISGYVLIDNARCEALTSLLEVAKSHNIPTVLDLAPHNIYKILTIEQISKFKDYINWVFVEINTAHRLVGLGKLDNVSPKTIHSVISLLRTYFKAGAIFINPTDALVFSDVGLEKYTYPHSQPIGQQSRGFSSIVQASLCYKLIDKANLD
jgi:sugar/nucleoside kinase (ribokinase family)